MSLETPPKPEDTSQDSPPEVPQPTSQPFRPLLHSLLHALLHRWFSWLRMQLLTAREIARVMLVLPVLRVVRAFAYSAHAPRPIPWRALLRLAVPLWLVTRLLALVETYLSMTLLRPVVAQNPPHYPPTLTSMVNGWRLWDGRFYERIVMHGYTQFIDAGTWPLYPLLAKPFELILGPQRWQIALLLVSNLATLAAFVLIGALAVQEDETLGAARRAMLILAAAPLALFLTATYSESLFLALATATLFCARRGQWRMVVLTAFLAALSRRVGVILVAPLLWEYMQQSGGWRTVWSNWHVMLRHWSRTLLVLGAAPLAVGLFSLYDWHVFGDPLAWVHTEAAYGRTFMWPWQTLGYTWHQLATLAPASFEQGRVLVDDVPLLAALALTAATIRRIPASFTLYLGGVLLSCTTAPIVGEMFPHALPSIGRYLLQAIPLYLVLGHAMHRYPWLETTLVGGGFALQALLVAFVINGGWLV